MRNISIVLLFSTSQKFIIDLWRCVCVFLVWTQKMSNLSLPQTITLMCAHAIIQYKRSLHDRTKWYHWLVEPSLDTDQMIDITPCYMSLWNRNADPKKISLRYDKLYMLSRDQSHCVSKNHGLRDITFPFRVTTVAYSRQKNLIVSSI